MGRNRFGLDDWKQCPVGKALQLLLHCDLIQNSLRNGWKTCPGIPAVGMDLGSMTLCGYLHGYRQLPTTFRGGAIQRRTLATHVLKVTSNSRDSVVWPFPDTTRLTSGAETGESLSSLMCGEILNLPRKAAHPRTLWYYRRDLNEAVVSKAGQDLAQRLGNWHCLTRRVNPIRILPTAFNLAIEQPGEHRGRSNVSSKRNCRF